MLFLLTSTAPDCFSTASYLQGDIQSRTLSLYLIPQIPLDPLCIALNNSMATAQVFFMNAQDFISAEFSYRPGVENVAEISISELSLPEVEALINVQAADYTVKIEKSADISGVIQSLSYLKIDVSSCWAFQVFSYGPDSGDEQFEFRLTPNNCIIPENARMYPVFTFKQNMSQVDMDEFQTGDQEGEYKQPYKHMQVTLARIRCRDVVNEAGRQQCYEFIQYVTNSQDYYFGIKLSYEINGIRTDVFQEADIYQATGSSFCAEKAELITYFYPDGYFMYHGQFKDFSECIVSQDSVYALLTGTILWDKESDFYQNNYTIDHYGKIQYENIALDMTSLLDKSFESYPQYIQYDENDLITGSFYYLTTIVRQCIYLVNMIIIDDQTIDLELRSQYFDVCQNFSEDFDFQLISEDLDIIYQQKLNLNYDASNPIQRHRFRLENKINSIVKKNPGIQFILRGASFFYGGTDINYSKDTVFLIIQLSYFVLYLSISLLTVLVYLKMQNRQE